MRSEIEKDLREVDPRFYANRSPNMREGDIPGWHNFEKSDKIQVNVVTVSSIIDDVVSQLPEVDLIELPNLDKEQIKLIGGNGTNGHRPEIESGSTNSESME